MPDATDRRQFLKTSLLGAASLAAAGCTRSWLLEEPQPGAPPEAGEPSTREAEAPPPSPSEATGASAVPALARITGPGVEADLAGALARLLEPLGGMGAFVRTGQTVLLKPNMGFGKPPAFRATTSSALIAAVARSALDHGVGKVIVADHPTAVAGDVIESMQLRPALAGLDVSVLHAGDDGRWVDTPVPRGKEFQSIDVLAEALEADVHIALPIAKSHGGSGFTGTLKGMMGLIRSRMGFHTVYDLHQAIVDLNTVLRPDLVIMDGIEVMSTGGPAGPGELVRCDTLIASTDPVAADAAGVRLAPLFGRKVTPGQVRHLRLAADQGLGLITVPPERRREIAMPAAG